MKDTSQNTTLLLKQCLAGNSKAQLKIYTLYYNAMYNTAYRILNNSFDAEDVMQEAFLNAFTKLHTFKAEVTFGAWLKRIVINGALQLIKKRTLETVTLDEKWNHLSEEDNKMIGFKEMQVSKVLQAISELKDNYRIAISLHLIEGYDYEEMMEIMNTSNENCRALVSRAKAKIRKELAN